EFVSHTWVMNPSFAGLLDDADPLLAGHGDRGTSFTVQGVPVRRRITDVPAFVTVRGGGYFFLPGGRALAYLSGR
ncbi:MAG: peroxidase, partial [Marmoricola sp.]